ncbi:inositol monophosphatase family protein [Sinisalibacter aestuarii]|uniref:3'(2'),5'-bisphosphate nucleotidase CysQ n=1 Tax=Sinisalibacter aestuarii TaxID=2949426 RepID=A0ABQ5LNE5_9RHOB|nr:3'(2'),5'-bisphosphate nucleotidase CysQ [Sinisalibacter aestuarii]GKY86308.1 3'(2'),5'-bisphosphate nucleotidase CysQ [Sinisalibacter aestuarii]
MPETDDLALLTDAARAAGEISRGYFQRAPKAWDKPGAAGPVTEADIAVNDMLEERLRAARPGYGWLSEESPDDAARLNAARAFVIDPLDGTRAFIEGDYAWAHALAVVDNGTVTAAAIYLPMTDKLYSAARGQGAHLNGARLAVSAADALDGATVLASRTNFEPWHWVEAQVPQVSRKFRSSLAYRMSLVGEGRFDAMLSLRPTWEWDVAAGSLVVEEAGGRVTDRRGAALRFNAAEPRVNGVVAAGPRVHNEITRRLV